MSNFVQLTECDPIDYGCLIDAINWINQTIRTKFDEISNDVCQTMHGSDMKKTQSKVSRTTINSEIRQVFNFSQLGSDSVNF